MNQSDRLNHLIAVFEQEFEEQHHAPAFDHMDTFETLPLNDRRKMLRALMNVRMPRPLPGETMTIQDAYLQARAIEKGVVRLRDIPAIADQDTAAAKDKYAKYLSIWQGDITRLAVDAIVNAANGQMLGCFQPLHACIDNCIHTYAGVQLRSECAEQMELLKMQYGVEYEQPTAKPIITPAYNLPSRYIIHIVGPIVSDKPEVSHKEDLSACYRNTLQLCMERGIKSVAFCCISTGVFHFPQDEAATIAVKTVKAFLNEHPDVIDRVIFNVFTDTDLALYEALLQ